MTRFYFKTNDEMVAGPFTGFELREAALARLLLPDTGVAMTADGPWTRAANVGLFSNQNVPLSHPDGTAVPEFRLKGVNEVFEGPFKLHELIDFAVRQLLPSNALIQPVGRLDWVPVNQFGILGDCLRGELSRNQTSAKHAPVSKTAEPLRWDPTVTSHDGPPPVISNVDAADLMADPKEDIDLILSDHRERMRQSIQERMTSIQERMTNKTIPKFKPKFKFKTAYIGGGAVALLLVGVLVWWIKQPSMPQTVRSEVIGGWVLIPSHKNGKAFGIAFNEDNTCVVFNSDGDCWSGDFQWLDNTTSEDESQPLGQMNSKVANTPSNHHRFAVKEGDGYIRLEGGFSGKEPMLGDIPIRECFVRQDGGQLWIGYLTNVDRTDASQSRDARWVQLWPRDRATSIGPLDVDMRGTALLARYSVPDEARPLDPFEITANSDPKSPEPRSLVRYGAQQLTLFADGSVRPYKAPKKSE